MDLIDDLIRSQASRPIARLFAVAALSFALTGCTDRSESAASPSPSEPAPAASEPKVESMTAEELGDLADSVAGGNYSLGYCSVRMNAPANCQPGKQASGVAPGCSHDNCTTAKANARTNLLSGIPATCGGNIDCGAPCKCIQKK